MHSSIEGAYGIKFHIMIMASVLSTQRLAIICFPKICLVYHKMRKLQLTVLILSDIVLVLLHTKPHPRIIS